MSWLTYLVAIVTCLVTTATRGCVGEPSYVALATYNAGLTPRINEYELRRNTLGKKLRNLTADVVCLQEVWFSSDVVRVVEDTNDLFPYSYSLLHLDIGVIEPTPPSDAPCSNSNTEAFLECFYSHCGHHPDTADSVGCARSRCGLLSLEQQCITCLALSDPATIMQSCLQNRGNHFNVAGLLLLSKRPIDFVNARRFRPERRLLLPRYYFSTEIEDIGTVACTHTTANLGPSYYEVISSYDNWAGQNLGEAYMMTDNFRRLPNVVVMGDLNSSPDVVGRDVISDMPRAYHLFRHRGYEAPYVDHLGICTWCVYNKLAHAQHNMILDHVLLRNHTALGAMRIMDTNLPGKNYPSSDHYGIMVIIQTL